MTKRRLKSYLERMLLWFRVFLFSLCVLGFHIAQAQPLPVENENERQSYLEQTRQLVSERVVRLSDRIDSLFGNTSYDDRHNTSTLRVEQTVHSKNGELGADSISATLNLYLPNYKKMEERVKNRIFGGTSGPGGALEGEEESSEISKWDFNQESGITGANPINYFARLRARRDFLSAGFVHSFYEQVGWSKNNEWEEKTSLTSDYAIGASTLFRFINDKDWAMTNRVLGTTHGPSLIHQISDKEGISYDLRYSTIIDWNGPYSKRASLGATYRRETDWKWIYLSFTPELAWERETNFKPLHNFYLSIEFVFGKKNEEFL